MIRVLNNWGWWDDEQPSEEIKGRVVKRLEAENWKIDIVLSHTCPYKYMPTEAFLPGIDPKHVCNETEKWLDVIEQKLNYSRWYCGHFHTEKDIHKMCFLYKSILKFE
jgi:3-oxoacid CoA-transferase subunit A